MNHLVLSGTATVVPSGTRSSCYRGPESELTPWRSKPCPLRNFPNLESFGFLLTDCASRWAVDSGAGRKATCTRPAIAWPKLLPTRGRSGHRVWLSPISLYKLRRTT